MKVRSRSTPTSPDLNFGHNHFRHDGLILMKMSSRFITGLGLFLLPALGMAADNGAVTNSPQAASPVVVPIKPPPNGSDYFNLRDGLENSEIKIEVQKKARVVFFGGSITQMRTGVPGGAWTELVEAYLKKRFSQTEFDFINAGIASMGTTPHSFRFTRDVLKDGPVDLLFVEAAVNDEVNGMTPVEMVRGMEGIVRQARISNPNIDIVMLHFVDGPMLPVFNAGKTPVVIECHEKVADYYGVPSMDIAKEVAERERAGEFSWLKDFKGIHPYPFGHTVYANSIERLLDAAWAQPLPADAALKPGKLPAQPLDEKSYFKGRLVDISQAQLGEGWTLVPDWKPTDNIPTRPGFVDVPTLVSEKPGSTLHLKFEGTAVGIFVASGPDVGAVEYSIDGGPFVSRDLFVQWSPTIHLPWANVLAADLAPGPHELTLRVADKSNPRSKGDRSPNHVLFRELGLSNSPMNHAHDPIWPNFVEHLVLAMGASVLALYACGGVHYLFYRFFRPETEERMRQFLEKYRPFFVRATSTGGQPDSTGPSRERSCIKLVCEAGHLPRCRFSGY